MAEKFTIQIQPNMSPEDAAKLENDLNKRFNKVSKKFGFNLQNSLKSAAKIGIGFLAGALAGIAGSVLTNPFDKINEDLNATLARYDDIATRAAEFGVSSGKYFKAVQVAGSAGIKDLDTILARFSERLNAARSGEDETLINFTNEKDLIDAFFAFSESVRTLDPTERNKAVEDVFGSKFGLRIAELLQTDIRLRAREFGKYSENQVSGAVNRLAGLEEVQAINREKQAADELFQKNAAISRGALETQDRVERTKTQLEAAQLSQYQVFADLKLVQERAALALEEIRAEVTSKVAPLMQGLLDVLSKILDAISWLRNKISKSKFFS